MSVSASYDRVSLSTSHGLLRSASAILARVVPPGYIVKESLGQTRLPLAPWLAVLNPDVTESPLRGLYLAYLFSEDRTLLHLALMQGITQVERQEGRGRKSRAVLRNQAEIIRQALGEHKVAGGSTEIDLRSKGIRQLAYEAAIIVAKTYEIADLPSDSQLAGELASMLDQYALVVEIVRQMPDVVNPDLDLAPPPFDTRRLPEEYAFRPKTSGQYQAEVRAHTEIRDRRHELLVKDYGEWLDSMGLVASTVQHPIDVVFSSAGRECLVELEVVRDANAAPAVREAIGQLFEYSFAYYVNQSKPEPVLVAVFSEPIGDFYQSLLVRLGIQTAWKELGNWRGFPAQKSG